MLFVCFGKSQVSWTFDDILIPVVFKVKYYSCPRHGCKGLENRTVRSLLFLTSLVLSRKVEIKKKRSELDLVAGAQTWQFTECSFLSTFDSFVWLGCPAAHVFHIPLLAPGASAWILVFRVLIKSLTFEGSEGWVTG